MSGWKSVAIIFDTAVWWYTVLSEGRVKAKKLVLIYNGGIYPEFWCSFHSIQLCGSKILADEITMLVTQSDCEACREWYLLNLMGKASFYLFSICCFDLEIDMNINLPKGNNISMPLMHSSYKIWD